jgi:Methyltransferase domain
MHAAIALRSGAPELAVVAAGAATLFVELALIRYVPGQVRVLGYFTNFVLLAAFLGFGLGMIAARRWPAARFPSYFAPAGLMCVVLLAALGNLLNVLPSSAEFLFLEYQEQRRSVPLYPFLAVTFAGLAACFVPLGHVVGRTLAGDRALLRYGLNLVGSLCGIALFAALSALSAPPWLWMALAAAFACVGLREAGWRWRALGIATAAIAAAASWPGTRDTVWSPYQKITLAPLYVHPNRGVVSEWDFPTLPESERAGLAALPRASGFIIRVNDDSFMSLVDLSDRGVGRHPELRGLRFQYDIPYDLQAAPRRVLILGAGGGNDAAAALRGGAGEVHAVEIDPEILRLADRHPERPYRDPRVTVHLDDARSFLARDTRHYDLIVFAMLDSHILLSSRSNVRLDSFVFTRESFALARERLAPSGLMVVSHAVGTPWFIDRMQATLSHAFGKPPVFIADFSYLPFGTIYVVGADTPPGRPARADINLLEDDWPFLYLPGRFIPRDYLLAMVLMALISLVAVRAAAGPGGRGLDWHFFALGAGFLLLETRGLGVLALHLGGTWSVNAAVFAGVLVMSLAATVVGARLARNRGSGIPWSAYALLGVLLALNYALPLAALAAMPLGTRIVLSVLLVSAPLFASGLVFALSLARTGDASRALASNLLGAMAGGMIEYLSMIVGFRALVPLAAAFYLAALAADRRARAGAISSAAS